MRLSEAMRLGAMLGPQARGNYLKTEDDDGYEVTMSCALGAAALGLGGVILRGVEGLAELGPLYNQFPWLRTHVACPACLACPVSDVPDMIINLNDDHRWTREQIADWLATIEPAEESVAEATPCEEAAHATI